MKLTRTSTKQYYDTFDVPAPKEEKDADAGKNANNSLLPPSGMFTGFQTLGPPNIKVQGRARPIQSSPVVLSRASSVDSTLMFRQNSTDSFSNTDLAQTASLMFKRCNSVGSIDPSNIDGHSLGLTRSMASSGSQIKIPDYADTLVAVTEDGGLTVRIFDAARFLEPKECKHLVTVKKRVPQTFMKNLDSFKCSHPGCNVKKENWVCLVCLKIFCGRYENKHSLQHHKETGHCVAMNLDDLSVWCYGCDMYLQHDFFPALRPFFAGLHKIKHGKEAPQPWVNLREESGALLGSPCPVVRSKTPVREMLFPGVFTEPCGHLDNIKMKADNIKLNSTCEVCKDDNEVLQCTTCGKTFCSRFASKHMLEHYKMTGHPISLNTADLSMWCYECDRVLDHSGNMKLNKLYNKAHMLKFNCPAPNSSSVPPLPDMKRGHSLEIPQTLLGSRAQSFEIGDFTWENKGGNGSGNESDSVSTYMWSIDPPESPLRKAFKLEDSKADSMPNIALNEPAAKRQKINVAFA